MTTRDNGDPGVGERVDAVVLGAGPAGLAAAAELGRAGFSAVVLDRADEVGSSWARHYDRLHLHTTRALSSLPGMRIPREYGEWVARDDFRAYLTSYAARKGLELRLGTEAAGVTRAANGDWRVDWRSASGAGALVSSIVVVATGYNHTPRIPDWPGLAGYRGRVVHSSEYRNPDELGAKSVLVVGPGNSGAEIAADLASAGVEVRLAMRTPPNIVLRRVAGIPSQLLVLSISPFPTATADRIARVVQKLSVGDLTPYGIAAAPRGIVTQMERDDVTPTIDVGLLKALREGSVRVVPSVAAFSPDAVSLADGSSIVPDAVIAATGYRRGLEPLFARLDALQPSGRPKINAAQQLRRLPGLYFLGYSNPLTGNLRQVAIDARAIARRARRDRVLG
jgi:putative flavoprotein involved in K+ transport